MDKPLVSIALCTYNGEKYLTEQLESIIYQTYSNIEIIAVDDCSSDGTLEILKSYQNSHPNFKIHQNTVNLGYIKNFEKAINLCEGEFIALSDQDDIWMLDKIQIQVENITDSLLIYHDSEFIDEDGGSLSKTMSEVLNMYEGRSFKPFMFFNCVSGHQSLFKKELVKYCSPFPPEIFHDRWLAFVATNNGKIKYLDTTLVKYRQHENSDTNILKLQRENRKVVDKGKNKIIKVLKELEIFASYQYNKDQKFINTLLNLYQTRLNNAFCFRLIFFMYAHYYLLLFISKKSVISKLNFIFKHLWGYKLKSN